jgi:hypothetical protein
MALIGKIPSAAEGAALAALVRDYGVAHVLCMIEGICEDTSDNFEANGREETAEQWRLAAAVLDQASTRCVELLGFVDG